MKTQFEQTRVRLPILIRYRAQDFETRYLDDPRVVYIEEFRDQHPDDGFLAMIARETTALAKRDLGSKWKKSGQVAVALASLSCVAYLLFS